jgi:Domain of unknown function (DUF4349)
MSRSVRGATVHRSALLLLVMTALVAVACASGAASSPAPAAAGGAAAPAIGNPQGEQPAAAPSAGPGQANGGTDAAFNDGAKIIRTGQLQLEVADVTKALVAARTAITGLGGYIGASQQYQDGEDTVATITYRIPADKWETALDGLRKLGKELTENTSSSDVTGQIVDLDARIRNLKASETALVGYISKATKVSDVLDIESRLSDVRGQIEQLTAQKANLDDQVSYATLAVTFGVNVPAVQAAAATWDPGGEADRAGATLVGFLQGLVTAGIWFGIVWLPILLLLAVVVGVVFVVGRRFGLFRRGPGAPPVPPMPSAPAEG